MSQIDVFKLVIMFLVLSIQQIMRLIILNGVFISISGRISRGMVCYQQGYSAYTVSLGKGYVSKVKQHHKHTASETQSHTQ